MSQELLLLHLENKQFGQTTVFDIISNERMSLISQVLLSSRPVVFFSVFSGKSSRKENTCCRWLWRTSNYLQNILILRGRGCGCGCGGDGLHILIYHILLLHFCQAYCIINNTNIKNTPSIRGIFDNKKPLFRVDFCFYFRFPTFRRETIYLFEYFFGVRDFCPFPVGLP